MERAYDVVADVRCVPLGMVNVCLIGHPDAKEWVLVDAGLGVTSGLIVEAAERRFGEAAVPAAIILTHGHFDHVGALPALMERWDCPVYAHQDELPYLTGKANYPPADPNASDGMIAQISPFFPRHGIDLGDRIQALPEDGTVPGAPGWRWIHTPGHTPGHISLFRDEDKVLVSGDAFVTVEQESALAVLRQTPEVNGPPAYFTPDWEAARESVRRLEALHPEVVAAGHGVPMQGEELHQQLQRLAADFGHLAVPEQGRYGPEEAAPEGRR